MSNQNDARIKVLFVCMGNICRSPLAEGVFNLVLAAHGLSDRFVIDSAGTSNYHLGELADHRAMSVANEMGITLTHRARKFTLADFALFDYILVMDHLNYDEVLSHSESVAQREKVLLLRSFDNLAKESGYEVPDPYYGVKKDFLEVCEIVLRASYGFISFLQHSGKL